MIGGSGDILCERMVGCWGNGPVWCSILVLQLRCEQGSCSIIYGSWVSKRILILRDRIPNFYDQILIRNVCRVTLNVATFENLGTLH